MNTQNTPVHISLWHKSFWALVFANMFLSMAVTMLIPTLPLWMLDEWKAEPWEAGCAMFSYGLGIFLLGGFCSYLVQRYRRNRVCVFAILGMVVCLGLLYAVNNDDTKETCVRIVWLLRLLFGAMFGLSQMVLSSTLIIDKTESFQRTEANHVSAWFRRFALSLGPVISIPLYDYYGFESVLLGTIACAVLAMILIRSVNFPFRAPDDYVRIWSFDRFFLPQSYWLFINLLLTNIVLGMMLSTIYNAWFYGIMMIGFFLAILGERFVFANADIKSEAVAGLVLIGMALLLMLTRSLPVVFRIVPAFLGFGFGIFGSRFMLFFIKLSRHCQRGTSQSSFFLAWEIGISVGLMIGYTCFSQDMEGLLSISLIFTIVSLLVYIFITHPWYMKHKNR